MKINYSNKRLGVLILLAGILASCPTSRVLANLPETDMDDTLSFTLDTRLPPGQMYAITAKDCTLTGSLETGLVFTGSNTKSSVKIVLLKKGFPGGVVLSNGMAPDPKNASVTWVEATILENIYVDGDMGKFYSMCPIDALTVAGSMRSLTTRDASLNMLTADGLGSLKIAANVDSTSMEPVLAIMDIQIGTLYGKPSNISLLGTVLCNLKANRVNIRKLTVGTKAYMNKEIRAKYAAYGSIKGGNIVAAEIRSLSVKSGDILPLSLVTTELSKSMSIRGKCSPFTVGKKGDLIKTFEGSDLSGFMDINTSKLQIILRGGNILADRIHTSGEITKIQASTKYDLGGHIGTSEAPYSLFVSGTDASLSKRGIKNVIAATGISGRFMSGATMEEVNGQIVFTPSFGASVGTLATRGGIIEGESWSQEPIMIKGDATGLLEHGQ